MARELEEKEAGLHIQRIEGALPHSGRPDFTKRKDNRRCFLASWPKPVFFFCRRRPALMDGLFDWQAWGVPSRTHSASRSRCSLFAVFCFACSGANAPLLLRRRRCDARGAKQGSFRRCRLLQTSGSEWPCWWCLLLARLISSSSSTRVEQAVNQGRQRRHDWAKQAVHVAKKKQIPNADVAPIPLASHNLYSPVPSTRSWSTRRSMYLERPTFHPAPELVRPS